MALHIISLIEALLANYGILGLILGIAVLSLLTTFLPLPIDIIVIYAAQRGFSPALIIVAATIGTAIAACIDYFLGYVGSPWVSKKIKKEKFESAHRWLEKWGMAGIIAASFIPLPFEIFAIAAGALKMDFYKFLFATLAGRLVKYSLVVYLGLHLLRLFGI